MSDAPDGNKFIEDACEKFVRELSEHCDSIRVFITTPHGNGETLSFSTGMGNHLAQYGNIRKWVIHQEHLERLAAEGRFNEGTD